MTKEVSLSIGIKNYLQNNIKSNEKVIISISCGLDSTTLFNLIVKSKYFKNKNIYYLIFDHQKRSEGKYEIKKFIKHYNLANKNLYVKKIFLKDNSKGFQEKSRFIRYDFLNKFCNKREIEHVFLGHHQDDLNETFFLRKIQQSGATGLSNIFLKKYKKLKLHRPLKKYSKKQIKSYANKNKLIWFEDRSNFELDFTRNKIRDFLNSNRLYNKINNERILFYKISILNKLHKNFFKRKKTKIFEINTEKLNYLNENLKFFVVQSFYYEYRHLLEKRIRDENIRNFIKTLKSHIKNSKEMSVFSGKIGVFNKKICINLT